MDHAETTAASTAAHEATRNIDRAETTEASTAAHEATRKRALEQGRPAFTAREDGAYHVLEMPKRHRRGYTANPGRARSHLLATKDDDAGVKDGEMMKRALELDVPDYYEKEEDGGGAYDALEMTKKFKCHYRADPLNTSNPLLNAVYAREARSLATHFRVMACIREHKAQAAARHQ